jgi:hypothetical protein
MFASPGSKSEDVEEDNVDEEVEEKPLVRYRGDLETPLDSGLKVCDREVAKYIIHGNFDNINPDEVDSHLQDLIDQQECQVGVYWDYENVHYSDRNRMLDLFEAVEYITRPSEGDYTSYFEFYGNNSNTQVEDLPGEISNRDDTSFHTVSTGGRKEVVDQRICVDVLKHFCENAQDKNGGYYPQNYFVFIVTNDNGFDHLAESLIELGANVSIVSTGRVSYPDTVNVMNIEMCRVSEDPNSRRLAENVTRSVPDADPSVSAIMEPPDVEKTVKSAFGMAVNYAKWGTINGSVVEVRAVVYSGLMQTIQPLYLGEIPGISKKKHCINVVEHLIQSGVFTKVYWEVNQQKKFYTADEFTRWTHRTINPSYASLVLTEDINRALSL